MWCATMNKSEYRVVTESYANGRIRSSMVTKLSRSGKFVADGLFVQWDESGLLQTVAEYKDGKQTGVYATFYNGDTVTSELHMKDGEPFGRVVYFGLAGECLAAGDLPDSPPAEWTEDSSLPKM